MKDFSHYKDVGHTSSTNYYVAESEPDILFVVPREGTLETPQEARDNVAFMYNYARTAGQPCGVVVIMANVLSQDPEGRRAYQEIDQKLVFAGGLVVESAMSRALASFFLGLSRPVAPTKLFDSVDKAVEWLRTMRPRSK